MIHSTIENWGNNKIADALIDTHLTKGSYFAFTILELGVELAASNLCVLEYAGRGFTHIVLSPFKEDCKVITGLNYLVEGMWKLVVAALLDYFIVFVVILRVLTLNGNNTTPLFYGATKVFNSKAFLFLHDVSKPAV